MCSICALDSVQVGPSKIAITCSAKYSTITGNTWSFEALATKLEEAQCRQIDCQNPISTQKICGVEWSKCKSLNKYSEQSASESLESGWALEARSRESASRSLLSSCAEIVYTKISISKL